jgi:hypothetical protein
MVSDLTPAMLHFLFQEAFEKWVLSNRYPELAEEVFMTKIKPSPKLSVGDLEGMNFRQIFFRILEEEGVIQPGTEARSKTT